jgi:hypothetical protein
MHWAMVFMVGEGAVCFGAFAFGNFQLVGQLYGGDAEEFVIAFDAAFDVGYQVVCCGDSARFQRAGKCARQSTSGRRDDVIDGRGHRLCVLPTIIFCVAAMRTEVQWFFKSFDVRVTKGPLLLHQADLCGMNEFAHEFLLRLQMLIPVKSYSCRTGSLLVILN